jgi:hypothetical protein
MVDAEPSAVVVTVSIPELVMIWVDVTVWVVFSPVTDTVEVTVSVDVEEEQERPTRKEMSRWKCAPFAVVVPLQIVV